MQDLHLNNDLRQPYQYVYFVSVKVEGCAFAHTLYVTAVVVLCSIPLKYLKGTRDDLPEVSQQQQIKELPPHPTLVFINPKSGGQMGKSLLKLFGEVVGVVQVKPAIHPQAGKQATHAQSACNSHMHSSLLWLILL